MTDLSGLFDPDRVAVIGATDREGFCTRYIKGTKISFFYYHHYLG
jgi:hypothetical protein